MEVVLQWMTANPWAGYIFVILVVFLVLVITLLFASAIREGREIQIWPPKIGARKSQEANSGDTGSKSEGDPQRISGSPANPPNFGFVDYKQLSHSLDNKAARIQEAKRQVWMIGATMHYTLNNCQQVILEKVRSGLEVYLLIADPKGSDYESTARCFGQDSDKLLKETEMTLEACKDILRQLKDGAKGSFRVKLMNRVFTSGVYFFDPDLEDGTMLFVPHVPGHDAPLVPGFLFRRVENGMLTHYFPLYRAVWNNFGKELSS